MEVKLKLNDDGDIDIEFSEGHTLMDAMFLINLAHHKVNMSYFGMVLRQREATQQAEAAKKPKILVPR